MGDEQLTKKDQARLAELESERFDYFVSLGRMSVGAATAKSKVVARKILAAEKKEAANEPGASHVVVTHQKSTDSLQIGPTPPVKKPASRKKK